MGMLKDRARRPTPPNPQNGHPWKCGCYTCAIYWDTAAGEATYNAARYAGPAQGPADH